MESVGVNSIWQENASKAVQSTDIGFDIIRDNQIETLTRVNQSGIILQAHIMVYSPN